MAIRQIPVMYENKVNAVVVIPSSGEFAYDTVVQTKSGQILNAIQTGGRGETDYVIALRQLKQQLPNVEWISIPWTFFGTSVNAARCWIMPGVEYKGYGSETTTSPDEWTVCGWQRTNPNVLWIPPDSNGNPFYGGTTNEASLVRAIQYARSIGYKVLFYPFIMMLDYRGDLPLDFPWRGRITGTADEMETFMTRVHGQQSLSGGITMYAPGGYNEFIRECIRVAALAGVDAFVVGSEMIGMTQTYDSENNYVAVPHLRQLAAEAKAALGANCKIGYTANWDEYAFHRHSDGKVFFPLDDLWADPNIDFIGIDYYAPLTDWTRQRYDYDGYLEVMEGLRSGEAYDYYYDPYDNRNQPTGIGREANRKPIDKAKFRLKDLWTWWSTQHFPEDSDGTELEPTAWVPCSKPIWLTEYGFPSVHLATNQPNVFYDPKSSESNFPFFSNKIKDIAAQRIAIAAFENFWANPDNNPVVDGVQMLGNKFLWCWDARPYPALQHYNYWKDAGIIPYGHWIVGEKIMAAVLGNIIADLCRDSGLTDDEFDVSDLLATVEGYDIAAQEDAKTSVQKLAQVYNFYCVESDGVLKFKNRTYDPVVTLTVDDIAVSESGNSEQQAKNWFKTTRVQDVELPVRATLNFINSDQNYQTGTVEARRVVMKGKNADSYSVNVVLSEANAKGVIERMLYQQWRQRDRHEFTTLPRYSILDAGDIVKIQLDGTDIICELAEISFGKPGIVQVTAASVGKTIGEITAGVADPSYVRPVRPSGGPVTFHILDVTKLTEDQEEHKPLIVAYGADWHGAGVFKSIDGGGSYSYLQTSTAVCVMGQANTILNDGPALFLDEGNSVSVTINSGTLSSITREQLNNYRNLAVLGNEIIQFMTATLIGENTYLLSGLRRGVKGTESFTASHAVGERFVLLSPSNSGAINQLQVGLSEIGLVRNYAIGPADAPADSPLYQQVSYVHQGNGMKPWSVCHVRGNRDLSGNLTLTWVRRSRTSSEWRDGIDMPLGETYEQYDIDIMDGGTVVRTVTTDSPTLLYTATQQVSDFGGMQSAVTVRIYQVNDKVGRGYVKEATI